VLKWDIWKIQQEQVFENYLLSFDSLIAVVVLVAIAGQFAFVLSVLAGR